MKWQQQLPFSIIVPGWLKTCGTFHYLLKYYTEGHGEKEKNRRKTLTSVECFCGGGGGCVQEMANPIICGRYSCVAGWLNCTSIECMYPLYLDKSFRRSSLENISFFAAFFFFFFLNSSKLAPNVWVAFGLYAGFWFALCVCTDKSPKQAQLP